jgi:threonine synthase
MSFVTGFQCLECERRLDPAEVRYICPSCAGNLDVLYDYDRAGRHLTREALARNSNRSMWRYMPLLPIEPNSPVPPLTVGWTPLYESARLASALGISRVLIKDDGRNPTASFKDRPSALLVAKARELGATLITTASSGNAGSALAGMCAASAMRSVIFVPVTAPVAKIAQLQVYGATVVLVEGSYDEAADLSLEAGERFGWYQRSTGYNPFTVEGKKTAAFEIAEQLEWQTPDRVIVGVGDGNIIGGLWKGFIELRGLGLIDRLPKITGVQADGAAPIVAAVNGDGVVRPVDAKTIADGICVGRPRDATRAVRAMTESGGGGITVTDEEILSAIGRLARETGVFAEPGAAASFAGLIRMCATNRIDKDETVVLVITGSGLKAIEAARRGAAEPIRIPPDLAELERHLDRREF